MRRAFLTLLTLLLTGAGSISIAHAQSAPGIYAIGRIESLTWEESREVAGTDTLDATAHILMLSGPEKGHSLTIEQTELRRTGHIRLQEGAYVVIQNMPFEDGTAMYTIFEVFRLPYLGVAVALFMLVIISTLGLRSGLASLMGLAVNGVGIIAVILPLLLMGYPPTLVIGVTASVLGVGTILISRGISRPMLLASFATVLGILFALIAGKLALTLLALTGVASEDAFTLQVANTPLHPQGLLLGGIIIGTLGVLDDVTTSQAQLTEELHRANPRATFRELFTSGMRVGRTHISGMVNTLILAYAGTALPLLMLLHISDLPLWLTVNNELIVEEIIRSIVGGSALILAVPFTSLLAARYYGHR